jgi:hypothetical protein
VTPRPPCPKCGWRGKGRSDLGVCVHYADCVLRVALGAKGRPPESACVCVAWPCPCVCHHEHQPEIWLSVADEDKSDPPPGA